MHYYHITLKSRNRKTGPITATTTSSDSCPPTCPFSGSGCYAQSGRVALHWRRVDSGQRGGSLAAFVARLRSVLRPGALWRHNQAGDLPGSRGRIDGPALSQIVAANARAGARGFTYTHYPILGARSADRANLSAVAAANRDGFAINASCETLADVDRAMGAGVPATVVTPGSVARGTRTPAGRPVLQCPATLPRGEAAGVTCATCGLCARSDRPYAIAFPAHGAGAAKARAALQTAPEGV